MVGMIDFVYNARGGSAGWLRGREVAGRRCVGSEGRGRRERAERAERRGDGVHHEGGELDGVGVELKGGLVAAEEGHAEEDVVVLDWHHGHVGRARPRAEGDVDGDHLVGEFGRLRNRAAVGGVRTGAFLTVPVGRWFKCVRGGNRDKNVEDAGTQSV